MSKGVAYRSSSLTTSLRSRVSKEKPPVDVPKDEEHGGADTRTSSIATGTVDTTHRRLKPRHIQVSVIAELNLGN